MATERRVWIGLLGSYNAGRLNGEWIDASDCDEDGIAELLARLQEADPSEGGEELDIFDAEGFDGIDPKCVRMWELAELDRILDERGAAVAAIVSLGIHFDDVSDLEDKAQDVIVYGPYSNPEREYGEQLADDMGLMKQLEDFGGVGHFDFESYGRDCSAGMTEITYDGETYLVEVP